MKARCEACGKFVQVTIPKGGDGSLYVYYRHRNPEGDYCEGSRRDVDEELVVDTETLLFRPPMRMR